MKVRLTLLLFCLLGIGLFARSQDKKNIATPKIENGPDAIPVTVKSLKKSHPNPPPPPPAMINKNKPMPPVEIIKDAPKPPVPPSPEIMKYDKPLPPPNVNINKVKETPSLPPSVKITGFTPPRFRRNGEKLSPPPPPAKPKQAPIAQTPPDPERAHE